jgi:nitrogen fixation-related uncharacterized protein
LWATKKGQFDDDYTPSVRMLFDDELRSNAVEPDDKKSGSGEHT